MTLKDLGNVVMISKELSDQRISESGRDGDSILGWYGGFFKQKWARDSGKIFQNAGTIKPTDEETELFMETIRRYMKPYEDMFSYAAAGSERVAFVSFDGKYCLKLCGPYDGYYVNQTQAEVRLPPDIRTAKCVYGILDWDEMTFASSLCECCNKVDEAVWESVFGISYGMTMRICERIEKHRTFDFPEKLLSFIRGYTVGNPDFIDMLIAGKEPAYASLKSWLQIKIDTNGQKLRDAMNHIENWGLTYENGKPVVKIIDLGL